MASLASRIRTFAGTLGSPGATAGTPQVMDDLALFTRQSSTGAVGIDLSSYEGHYTPTFTVRPGGTSQAYTGPTGAPGTPPSAVPPSPPPVYPPKTNPPMLPRPPVANPNGPLFNPLSDPGAIDPFAAYSPAVNPITSDQGRGLVGLAGSQCGRLTGAARVACEAAAAIGGILLGGGGPGQGGDLTQQQGNCATGYHKDSTGRCVKDGIEGYIERTLPFGETGVAWEPVAGRYGIGSLPVLVQSARRACPNGMVLGKDGVCYEHLARGQRAWNPGAKPMLTGGDVNALRRAKTLKKKITKLQRAYAPAPKACGPKTRKR